MHRTQNIRRGKGEFSMQIYLRLTFWSTKLTSCLVAGVDLSDLSVFHSYWEFKLWFSFKGAVDFRKLNFVIFVEFKPLLKAAFFRDPPPPTTLTRNHKIISQQHTKRKRTRDELKSCSFSLPLMSLWERAIVVFFSIDNRAWVEWGTKKFKDKLMEFEFFVYSTSLLLCFVCGAVFFLREIEREANLKGRKIDRKMGNFNLILRRYIFFLLLDYKDLNKSNHLSLDICQSECRSHSITQCCFFYIFRSHPRQGRLRDG